jgi:hypothetical protein
MDKPKQIPFADVSRELDKGIAAADKLRADQLDRLMVARRAKDRGLKREQARLAEKLGADHPRVTEIAGRLKLNAGMQRDLVLESARAHTEIPKVDEKSWALLGFVRDRHLEGVSGVTVALYDSKGEWVERLGYAPTSDDGRFRIQALRLNQVEGPVHVRVIGAQSVVLYTDPVALTPAGGKIDYREIILSRNGPACPPPSGRQPGSVVTPETWTVRGRVTDGEGNGLSGLVVSVYDQDLFFHDRLGQTQTRDNGDYQLTFRTEDFRDLIEREPEIYVKVMDQDGETLYTSTRSIRFGADNVKVINVEIKKRGRK